MGKASSAKKVARAARAGAGNRPGERRQLGFPALVIGLIVIGLATVAFARASRDAEARPRVNDDHWHSVYAVYDCLQGTILPTFQSTSDPQGIHSHGDGLIHIHPFFATASGDNAQMGVFFEAMGVDVTPEGIELDDGTTLGVDGVQCDGKDVSIRILRWDNGFGPEGEGPDTSEPDEVFTDDFADIRFTKRNEAYMIVRAPEDAELPAFPLDRIQTLGATSPEDPIEVQGSLDLPETTDDGATDEGVDGATEADGAADGGTEADGAADAATDEGADGTQTDDGTDGG